MLETQPKASYVLDKYSTSQGTYPAIVFDSTYPKLLVAGPA